MTNVLPLKEICSPSVGGAPKFSVYTRVSENGAVTVGRDAPEKLAEQEEVWAQLGISVRSGPTAPVVPNNVFVGST